MIYGNLYIVTYPERFRGGDKVLLCDERQYVETFLSEEEQVACEDINELHKQKVFELCRLWIERFGDPVRPLPRAEATAWQFTIEPEVINGEVIEERLAIEDGRLTSILQQRGHGGNV